MHRVTAIAAVLFVATATAGVAGANPLQELRQGRSVAPDLDGCDSSVEVCGVMGPDRLVLFANRCEARKAGAERVLVGHCLDDD